MNPELTGFASYRATSEERLQIHIADPLNEKIYYGFGYTFRTNQLILPPRADSTTVQTYYRIRRPDGKIVVQDTVPRSGAGFIRTYEEAVAGPNVLQGNFGTGYNPRSYQPDTSGDYYIEFSRNKIWLTPTQQEYTATLKIDLFDISVVNKQTLNPINGRLWAKTWDLSCLDGNTQSFASFYIYTPDSIVTRFYTNQMKPFGFSVMCNATGVRKTGDIYSNRQSTEGKEFYPEYKIFLSDPDINEYPTGHPAQLVSKPAFATCNGINYCIKVSSSKNAYADAYIEINGIPGYQRYSSDVKFDKIVSPGNDCLPWNGKDGKGNLVPPGTRIEFFVNLITGLTNFPVYDAEFNDSGFVVTSVRPIDAGRSNPLIFFDDSQIGCVDASIPGCSTLKGPFNLAGCPSGGNFGGCHRWGKTDLDKPQSNQSGFGNQRTINTWWSSYNLRADTALVVPPCQLLEVKNQYDTIYKNTPTVTFCPERNNVDRGARLDTLFCGLTRTGRLGSLAGTPTTSCFQWTPTRGITGNDTLVVKLCSKDGTMTFYDTTFVNIRPLLPPKAIRTDTTIGQNSGVAINNPNSNNKSPASLDNSKTAWIPNGKTPKKGSAIILPTGYVQYTPFTDSLGNDTVFVSICNIALSCTPDTIVYHIVQLPPINRTTRIQIASFDTIYVNPNADNKDQNGNNPLQNLIASLRGYQTKLSRFFSFSNGVIKFVPRTNLQVGSDTVLFNVCTKGKSPICRPDTVIFNLPYSPNVTTVPDTINAIVNGPPLNYSPFGNDLPQGLFDSTKTSLVANKGPRKGVVVFNSSTGGYTYTPNRNVAGPDSFQIQVCTRLFPVKCGTEWQYVRIKNLPPVPKIDSVAIDQNAIVYLNPSKNDFDPNANIDTNSVTLIKPAKIGVSTVVPGTGRIKYVVNSNYPNGGIDTVIVKVCDLGPSPEPKYCVNDTIYYFIPKPIQITVQTGLDSANACGDSIQFNPNLGATPKADLDTAGTTLAVLPRGGKATIVNGIVTYKPGCNFLGTDMLVTKICSKGVNSQRKCKLDTTYINILNQPPTARMTIVTLANFDSIIVNPNLDNYDPNNNIDTSLTTVRNGGRAAQGRYVVRNGLVVYYPKYNATAGLDFCYINIFDKGGLTVIDTVQIIIPNAPFVTPVPTFDTLFVNGLSNNPPRTYFPANNNTPLSLQLRDTLILIKGPTKGTVSIKRDSVIYIQRRNESGYDFIVVGVSTNVQRPSIRRISPDTIYLYIKNRCPVAKTGYATVTSLVTPMRNIYPLDLPTPLVTDPDNNLDKATLRLDSALGLPHNGKVQADILPNGTVYYTPTLGLAGLDTINLLVSDRGNPVCTVPFRIIIYNPFFKPITRPDSVVMLMNGPKVSVNSLRNNGPANLLDSVFVDVVPRSQTIGTANWNITTKRLDYTPRRNYSGFDMVVLKIYPVSLPTSPVNYRLDTNYFAYDTVYINLNNVAPVIRKTVVVMQDTVATVFPNSNNYDANDNAIDSLKMQIVSVNPPRFASQIKLDSFPHPGRPSLLGKGNRIRFRALPGDSGWVNVYLKGNDIGTYPQNFEFTDTVSFYIPYAPKILARRDYDTILVNSKDTLSINPNLNNWPRPYLSDSLTTIVSGPKYGNYRLTANGIIKYLPKRDSLRSDRIIVRVYNRLSGPFLRTSLDTIYINLLNLPPVCLKQIVDVPAVGTDPLPGVYTLLPVNPNQNNTDPNDNINPNAIGINSPRPYKGQVKVQGPYVYYAPKANYLGYDYVFLKISDKGGLFSQDTIIFNIVNSPPTASTQIVGDSAFKDGSATVDPLKTVTDPNNNVNSNCITILNPPTLGKLVKSDNGQYVYKVPPYTYGTDSAEVTVCDLGGLSTTFIIRFVLPSPVPDQIEIPEGFSPNGDGINDLFYIEGLRYLTNKLDLTIYNRWGSIIYHSDDYHNDWDGTPNHGLHLGGGPVPDGTYYYLADKKNGEKPVIRFFTIKR